jgi:nucleoid DNA-binding protein
MGIRRKREIDYQVAWELGLPLKHVAEVTSAFIEELRTAIAEHGGFQLEGLGRLVMRFEGNNGNVVPGKPKQSMRVKLYFRKAAPLKAQIEKKLRLEKG